MKTFKVVILSIVCSLVFGLAGGFLFTGAYEFYKKGS